MKKRIAIVGAGFSGCTLARLIAEHTSSSIEIFEKRSHIGGNCHTQLCPITNNLEHVYGPHIFHTNNRDVWDFVNRFGAFYPYKNQVKAHTPRGIFSMPINLHTINQLFNKTFTPEEAEKYIKSIAIPINNPQNFEEQALSMVGETIYKTFFYGYTKKQWGRSPKELPASILKRLPLRFTYNDNYYNALFQGLPKKGYTELMQTMIDHPQIAYTVNTQCGASLVTQFDHVYWSGPIDAFFKHTLGRLRYRTVTFEKSITSALGQGNAVINYTSEQTPYTRVHQHNYFAPWDTHEKGLLIQEYSKETTTSDEPFYPLRLEDDKKLYDAYLALQKPKNLTFLGRLGTYAYLDMDRVIAKAMELFTKHVKEKIYL